MIVAVAFGHHARGFGQLDVGHAFGYNFLTGSKTGDDLAPMSVGVARCDGNFAVMPGNFLKIKEIFALLLAESIFCYRNHAVGFGTDEIDFTE